MFYLENNVSSPNRRSSGFNSLSQSTQKKGDSPPKRAKHNSAKLASMLEQAGEVADAWHLRECGSFEMAESCECGKTSRQLSRSCKKRICPRCQSKRAFKRGKEIEAIISYLQKQKPFSGMLLFFGSFTIPNCSAEELNDKVTSLINGYKHLLRRPELRPYLIGSFRSIEIQFNKRSRDYHPHIHCIIAFKGSYIGHKGAYINQDRWRDLWKQSMGLTISPEVKVSRITPKRKFASIGAAAAAKVQYSMKPLESKRWVPKGLAAFNSAVKRRRLHSLTGAFARTRRELPPYVRPCTCPACNGELTNRTMMAKPTNKHNSAPALTSAYEEKKTTLSEIQM